MTDAATDAATGTTPAAAGPLAGLTVLDFGHTVMGPSCGVVLADLGADVIRVEPPEGDRTRRLGGFGTGFFATYNRNKRSLAVNLKDARGLDVVRRLVRRADALVENFAPGTMDRLGLGWDAVRTVNPRLIYCSLKGFLPGPYEALPALDEVVQMQGGLAVMTGPPGQPLRAGTSVVDIAGGMFGALGILAALRRRDATGEGELVRASLFESVAFMVGQHIAAGAATGERVPPMTARRATWAIYDVLAASDGQVFVGAVSDGHWARLLGAFDMGPLADDPSLATNAGRVAGRDRIMPVLARHVAAMTVAEVMARCRAALLPCAPVAHPSDLEDDAHLLAAGSLADTDLGGGRRARIPMTPLAFGDAGPRLTRQPPATGADTADILASLGIPEEEVASLRDAGVVGVG